MASTVKIRSEPSWQAEVIGTIRGGQSVRLSEAAPAYRPSCRGGWFAVRPRGFVCVGSDATRDEPDATTRARAEALPDRSAAYPYRYGVALGSPRYRRLPTPQEQRRSEPGLDQHLASAAPLPEVTRGPSPALQAHLAGTGPLRDPLDAYPGMKVAWARELRAEGRTWLLTPELLLIPADKVATSATVPPRGVAVSRSSPSGAFEQEPLPTGVGPDDKWVLVRVNQATLIAYEGTRAEFRAVISPGVSGANRGPHRTSPGRYRVSSKAITAHMSGELEGGVWRTRDVPWVAYYDGSHALHGAWWHDDFGRPRSHGCINLTPQDARWLFEWLDPPLPEGWHAVRADRARARGTLIIIRP
ncbi:MAG: L,D-transpeptidase [Deltaproteobacteria bacterium]|nr:L,D-transpeptidase [Deltaproteobacteria bacterium]